ncbi:N-acetylmuramoyl-L-alanine amidase [Phaeovibrio sulfidiphilus]|uniref:N-acetylmuramoyl-L-alanine amidase n=1 Tax=Phaeovibrio sulfidiphilus TaxID=1220600 RepID=A0A8J6YLI0_9PROT|nr:N-acetylmuramoyl-L-alanine amidase [Phaeovibrio sulfidiphilus]MBE1236778.1 N-acetylmuramoyl-L-alanine amidase [Phaeovibrio sulfidiphilus]
MQVFDSPNQDARPDGVPVDTLVLHYTGMTSGRAAFLRMMDPQAQVSAHWMVAENGALTALVPEHRRAWHAGVSFWRGHTGLNARSIGIEIVNPGHEYGYRPFPEPQMRAVIRLCRAILSRHPIGPQGIVAHSDIAPVRKEDPGELFDWPRLAREGVGLFPSAPLEGPDTDPATLLAAIGYDTSDLTAAVRAFQRRYRPARIDGCADDLTLGLMRAVLKTLTQSGAAPSPAA